MTEPTDADRKHAAELIYGNRPRDQAEAVARALAERTHRPAVSPELRWVAERTYRASKNRL